MRSRVRLALAIVCLAFVPSAARSQNLVALASTAGGLQLATIGIGTGVVTLIGPGAIPGGGISMSGGISAYDAAANRFYFVGTPSTPPGSTATLYSISAATGLVVNSAALTGSAINGTLGLAYDAGEGVLYGVASAGPGDRQIMRIEITPGPTFGQVTLLGAGVGGGSGVSTVGATEDLDAAGNRYLFCGDPGSGYRLYSVSTVGPSYTITSAPLSGAFPGTALALLGLEYDDDTGTLYGLAMVGAGDRQLVSIADEGGSMGLVTLLGSAIAGEGLSTGGPEASDPAGNRYFFIGTPNSGSVSLYQLNTSTGATSDTDPLSGGPILGVSGIQYDSGTVPVTLQRFDAD